LTNLGLKEAKDVAETAGSKILEGVSKEAANDAKGKLETAGAVVEVQ
jgi:large subunit ribosomal protein L7/L12